MIITPLLKLAVERNASDLLFSVDAPITIKIDGISKPINDQRLDADSARRIADGVASFGGSWTFIILFSVVLIVYTAINHALGSHAWDPYPFILLNLFLSMLAAVQAPVIMMSQNRQDAKDRLRSELDFAVNRRAESEIKGLALKLRLLGDKIDDLEDALRPAPGAPGPA